MDHTYIENHSEEILHKCEDCLDKLLENIEKHPLDMVQKINLPPYVQAFYTSRNIKIPLSPQVGEDIAINVVKYTKELINETTNTQYVNLLLEKTIKLEEKINYINEANQITFGH